MNNTRRAQDIIAMLDQLTHELKDLTEETRAKERITDIRTEMGFEKGGYVGHITFDELLDEKAFEEQDDEEE